MLMEWEWCWLGCDALMFTRLWHLFSPVWTELRVEETASSVRFLLGFFFCVCVCSVKGQQSLKKLACRSICFPFKMYWVWCLQLWFEGKRKQPGFVEELALWGRQDFPCSESYPPERSPTSGSDAGIRLIFFSDKCSQKLTGLAAWNEIQDN